MTPRRGHFPLFSCLNADAKQASMLSAHDEIRLARQSRAGSAASSHALVRSHLRLVFAIVRQCAVSGSGLEDLVSEGMLGLVEAARRFDPERGVRFAVYATWWIRARVRNYTILNRRIVRLPSSRSGRKILANLRRAQRELTQRKGEAPDVETVAASLGVDVCDVAEMEAALSCHDRSVGCERGDVDLPATEPSSEMLLGEREAHELALRAVREVVEGLNARERSIIEQRWLAGTEVSLAAIGRDMGVSRERVRQLELAARAKIRAALTAN